MNYDITAELTWTNSAGSDTMAGGSTQTVNPPPYVGQSYNNVVTVQSKTIQHPRFSVGSDFGYVIGGVEGATIDVNLGDTITFLQSNSSNTGHRIRIYLQEDKSIEVTQGVTVYGEAGSAGPPIGQTVFEPQLEGVYWYQCENHAYMGGRINVTSP